MLTVLLVVRHGRDNLSRITTGIMMLRVQLHFHFRSLFAATDTKKRET